MPLSRPSLRRRGSYAALFAVTAPVFIGFGALAVDLALIRLADAEIQAVADAAAQAAILRLRATSDRTHAEAMAAHLVSANLVAGSVPSLASIEFGTFADGTFSASSTRANAVRVDVSAAAPLTFASLWDRSEFTVRSRATAATRTLHTVVVMDITNSWSWSAFEGGREGAVTVFDQLTGTSSPNDRIGMVVFTGQYGTEFTPLTPVDDAVTNGVRTQWAEMRTASKAGVPSTTNGSCSLHGGSRKNDFDDPPGGCYPNMPREYRDESGTDHAVGIEMATTMFAEQSDPSVYRAMIILTDGSPNGTGRHEQRADAGFEDTRWRYTFANRRRGTSEVRTESVTLARDSWDRDEINIWSVSYRANATWMEDVSQGDGYYVRATNSADLQPIFADIVESLPVALVE